MVRRIMLCPAASVVVAHDRVGLFGGAHVGGAITKNALLSHTSFPPPPSLPVVLLLLLLLLLLLVVVLLVPSLWHM